MSVVAHDSQLLIAFVRGVRYVLSGVRSPDPGFTVINTYQLRVSTSWQWNKSTLSSREELIHNTQYWTKNCNMCCCRCSRSPATIQIALCSRCGSTTADWSPKSMTPLLRLVMQADAKHDNQVPVSSICLSTFRDIHLTVDVGWCLHL